MNFAQDFKRARIEADAAKLATYPVLYKQEHTAGVRQAWTMSDADVDREHNRMLRLIETQQAAEQSFEWYFEASANITPPVRPDLDDPYADLFIDFGGES